MLPFYCNENVPLDFDAVQAFFCECAHLVLHLATPGRGVLLGATRPRAFFVRSLGGAHGDPHA